MFLDAHQLADSRESLEVGLLRRHQRISSEMRQHFRHQIADVPHFELECLVRSIRPDESASPFLLDHVEKFGSVCVLAHRETRPNLPPEAVPLAGLERDAETAFTIHETGDVGIQIHRKDQGRRLMKPCGLIQGFSTLESLRGKGFGFRLSPILPSVLPAAHLPRWWGFTDLSRLNGTVSPPPRAMLLTRQGISLP